MSRGFFQRDFEGVGMPLDHGLEVPPAAERPWGRSKRHRTARQEDHNTASDNTTGTEETAGNHEEKDKDKDTEKEDKSERENEGGKRIDNAAGMPQISPTLSRARTEVNKLQKTTTKKSDIPSVAVDCAILIRKSHAPAEVVHCQYINRRNLRHTVSSVAQTWKGVTFYGFPVPQNIPDFWELEKLETQSSISSELPVFTFRKPHRRIRDVAFIPNCQAVEDFKNVAALDSDLQEAGANSGTQTDPKLLPEGRSTDAKSEAAETAETYESSTENPNKETEDSAQAGHDEASSPPVTEHWAKFSPRFSKLALQGTVSTSNTGNTDSSDPNTADDTPTSKKKRFRPMIYQLVYLPDKACSLVVNGHLASALFHTLATSAAFRLRMLEGLWRKVEDRGVRATDSWLYHEERRVRLLVDIVSVYPVQRMDHLWGWYIRVQVNKRVLLERSLAWLTSKKRQFAFLPEYFAFYLEKISVRETARQDRLAMTDVRHAVYTTQGQRERTAWAVFKAFSYLHGTLPSKAFVMLLQLAMSDVKQDMMS